MLALTSLAACGVVSGLGDLEPVGGCVGGFDALRDMSGND